MTPRLKRLLGKMLVRPLTDDEHDELALEYASIMQEDELDEFDAADEDEAYDFDDLDDIVDELVNMPGSIAWSIKPKEKYKN